MNNGSRRGLVRLGLRLKEGVVVLPVLGASEEGAQQTVPACQTIEWS
jgi:hypothetical protein